MNHITGRDKMVKGEKNHNATSTVFNKIKKAITRGWKIERVVTKSLLAVGSIPMLNEMNVRQRGDHIFTSSPKHLLPPFSAFVF